MRSYLVSLVLLISAANANDHPLQRTNPLIPRTALFGSDTREFVRLSPDGRHVSFVAPSDGVPNVWVAPLNDLRSAKVITHDSKHGVTSYEWAFDNRHIVFPKDTDGNGVFHYYSVDIVTDRERDLVPLIETTARWPGDGWLSPANPNQILLALHDKKGMDGDIYEVDLNTGNRKLSIDNKDGFMTYYFGHTQNAVAAEKVLPGNGRAIFVRNGNAWRQILSWSGEDVTTTAPLRVISNDTELLMRSSIGHDESRLVRLNLSSGKQTTVSTDWKAGVVDTWNEPRTGEPQAYTTEYLGRKTIALLPSIRSDIALLESKFGFGFNVSSRTLDDQKWIVEVSEPTTGISSHLYERSSGTVRKLFDYFPQLSTVRLQKIWPIEIEARDGLKLVSYLTLPSTSSHDGAANRPSSPVPMVLVVHGGPSSRDTYGFRNDHQWLADRGYAVLSVNFRGSTGFGKAFFNAGNLQMGGKMQDDLVDAVDWAIREKIADPQKVAIFGESYGGYATLAGLAFTPDLFACGVDVVGPTDLLTMFAAPDARATSLYEYAIQLLGDPRTEKGRQLLRERSPLAHAHRIIKPVLIAQGANDPAVPRDQSDRIVAALKTAHRAVTYILYPDEGHGFVRRENQLSFLAVAEAFLAQHLGGRVEPFGNSLETSSINIAEGRHLVDGLSSGNSVAGGL